MKKTMTRSVTAVLVLIFGMFLAGLAATPASGASPVAHGELPGTAFGSFSCGDTMYTTVSGTIETIFHEIHAPGQPTYQVVGFVFHDVVAVDQDGNEYVMRGSFRFAPFTLAFKVPIIRVGGGGVADTINAVFNRGTGAIELGTCDIL
jgi:hypothetical protein